MAIPKLAMIPSGYKDGKVYSVLPSNGDGDFTFSRGSNATRVNKDGLIETMPLEVSDTELVTNGGFDTDSDWVKLDGTTINGGAINFNVTNTGTKATQSNVTTVGLMYKVTFEVTNYIGGNIYISGFSIPLANRTVQSNGVFSFYSEASLSTLTIGTTSSSCQLSINNVSVKEVISGYDLPRLDYTDSSCPSLLLEPQRTNNLLQSNQFDTAWTSANATVTSGQIGVGGSVDAWELEKTATNGYIRHIGVSVVDGSISIYAKKGSSNWFRLGSSSGNIEVYFDLNNGIIGNKGNLVDNANITDMGDGWYRCSYSYTGAATGVYLYPADSNGDTSGTSGSVYIQYAQIEQGSYATSYIPTNGAVATRLADECNDAGASDTFNDSEGVLMAEISALANDGTNRRISISNGTTSDDNRINLMYIAISNSITINYKASGTTRVTFTYALNDITNYNKVAMLYKSGDFRFYVNGFKLDTDSNTTMIADGTLSELAFEDATNSNNFYGKIKQIQYFNTALTDQELQALTS
jgi:hypothetical protein